MHIVEGAEAVLKGPQAANKDGKDNEALQFLQANSGLSSRAAADGLKELGIKRSPSWVLRKVAELKGNLKKTGS